MINQFMVFVLPVLAVFISVLVFLGWSVLSKDWYEPHRKEKESSSNDR